MQTEDYADLYQLEEDFWWFAGMREITAALLDPVFSPGGGNQQQHHHQRRILDAGCGTGGMLSWLKRYAGGEQQIVGIDLVHTALEFCRARTHKQLAQASATHLPFADEVFDLVTSFDVLVQIPGQGSDQTALDEMYRVLRPGGIAFVRVAAYEWMRSGHDEALGTQRRYSLKLIGERVEQAGFRVLRGTYANSLLLPIAVIRRLVLKPLGIADRGSDVKPLPPNFQWLNRTLTKLLTSEARRLKHSGSTLPAGLSAICVGLKPRG